MTYKHLANLIMTLSEEQQNQDVTIYSDCEEEFYPSVSYGIAKEDDVLDKNHFYLTF